MTSKLTDQDRMIHAYGEGPILLEKALTGLTEADLDRSLDDETWTIREIVHHLIDGDDIWRSFIKQAMGNPGGEFILQWYWQIPQNEWVEHWKYKKRPIEPSLVLFKASRNHIVQILEIAAESMDNALMIQWSRGGEQEVSIGWVVRMQTQHVLDHVKDIETIRERHAI